MVPAVSRAMGRGEEHSGSAEQGDGNMAVQVRTHLRDEETDAALCARAHEDDDLVDEIVDASCVYCQLEWNASGGCGPAPSTCIEVEIAEVVVEVKSWAAPDPTTILPAPLKPVPPTVYRKRPKKSPLGGPPVSRIALYVMPHTPTWWIDPNPAAVKHSDEWKEWYRKMPANMSAKQERAYFLRGPAK